VSDLAERLARKALKTFWLPADPREEGGRALARIRSDPEWPALAGLLERHDLLETSIRQRSGAHAAMMHLKCPKEILEARASSSTGMPSVVVEFWAEVRSLE